jgi:hypothetical protein
MMAVKADYRGLFIEAQLVEVIPQVAAAGFGAQTEVIDTLKHSLQGMAAPSGSFLGPFYGVVRWNQL